MEDYNDILIEDDVVKFISFNGGIYGTNAVIVDAAIIFVNIAFKNIIIRTGARETYELLWQKDSVELKNS